MTDKHKLREEGEQEGTVVGFIDQILIHSQRNTSDLVRERIIKKGIYVHCPWVLLDARARKLNQTQWSIHLYQDLTVPLNEGITLCWILLQRRKEQHLRKHLNPLNLNL